MQPSYVIQAQSQLQLSPSEPYPVSDAAAGAPALVQDLSHGGDPAVTERGTVPRVGDDDQTADVGSDPTRSLALSDGIFAIAMTLLAFQIQPPDLPDNQVNHLAGALADMSVRYFVYLLSFTVIGLFWMAHHRFFRCVERVDESLLLLNLFFLMVVAALPFPSSVLARYGSQPVAVIIYAAAMALEGAVLTGLWIVAVRHRLLRPDVDHDRVRDGIWRGASTTVVFGASIPVAVWLPGAAPYLWLAVLPIRLWPGARRRRSAPGGRRK